MNNNPQETTEGGIELENIQDETIVAAENRNIKGWGLRFGNERSN
jgi:hypothetical protein